MLTNFSFGVYSLFNDVLSILKISFPLVQLSINRKPKPVLRLSYRKIFIKSNHNIKLFYYNLQIFSVSNPVFYLFQLILAGHLYLFIDLVHKDLKLSQIVMEKSLKSILIDVNQSLSLDFLIILLLVEQSLACKKNGDKKSLNGVSDF